MLNGFKDFLFRGNIVDLAVAVVIGTAFTALVGAFTTALIEPIINLIQPGEASGFKIALGDSGQALDFGLVLNAIITFLITAAVVYFVFVVPSKKLMEKMAKPDEVVEEAPGEDVVLLREIRDALTARGTAGPTA